MLVHYFHLQFFYDSSIFGYETYGMNFGLISVIDLRNFGQVYATYSSVIKDYFGSQFNLHDYVSCISAGCPLALM